MLPLMRSDYDQADDEPPRWGELNKPRTEIPARILSIGPAHVGAAGPAGQAATHVISIETESSIQNYFIDLRSATLLLAIGEYLNPVP